MHDTWGVAIEWEFRWGILMEGVTGLLNKPNRYGQLQPSWWRYDSNDYLTSAYVFFFTGTCRKGILETQREQVTMTARRWLHWLLHTVPCFDARAYYCQHQFCFIFFFQFDEFLIKKCLTHVVRLFDYRCLTLCYHFVQQERPAWKKTKTNVFHS